VPPRTRSLQASSDDLVLRLFYCSPRCSITLSSFSHGDRFEQRRQRRGVNKVVGALCEKSSDNGEEESKDDEQNFCRHFQDEREVASILTRNPEAFAVIVTEVRGFLKMNAR